MIDIDYYLNDGANWQAMAVLACLRNHKDLNKDYKIEVGRLENHREQGYVFTLLFNNHKHYRQIVHYAVYEHRNSDQIVVKRFHGSFLNTPTIDQIPYKDKYDVTEWFSWGEITKVVEWLNDDFKLFMDDPFWDLFDDDEAIHVELYDKENEKEKDFHVCVYMEDKTLMRTWDNEYYVVNFNLKENIDANNISELLQHVIDIEGMVKLNFK